MDLWVVVKMTENYLVKFVESSISAFKTCMFKRLMLLKSNLLLQIYCE